MLTMFRSIYIWSLIYVHIVCFCLYETETFAKSKTFINLLVDIRLTTNAKNSFATVPEYYYSITNRESSADAIP